MLTYDLPKLLTALSVSLLVFCGELDVRLLNATQN